MSSWISIVHEACAKYRGEFPKRYVGREPAPESPLAELERIAGMPVPSELRELLLETNGVMEQRHFGDGNFHDMNWLIDPVAEMTAWFKRLKEDDNYEDLTEEETRGVFFFGGPGWDGVRFGFGDGVRFPREAIVVYYPMGGDLEVRAPTFRDFLEHEASGQ